jgi:hypothetical protein
MNPHAKYRSRINWSDDEAAGRILYEELNIVRARKRDFSFPISGNLKRDGMSPKDFSGKREESDRQLGGNLRSKDDIESHR